MDRKELLSSGAGIAQYPESDAFRLLVESTVDYAIFMLDPTGRVATWNQGAERIKGYAPHEILGKHFSIFYTPDAVSRGWPSEELARAARDGRFEDEGWRVRKDGSRFWANVIISAVKGADGTLLGYAKVTRDVSERRANEERIGQLREQLEQRVAELAAANEALSQKSAEIESFVYGVSHDLRSPLVNLQGFSHELTLTSSALKELLSRPDVPGDLQQRALSLLTGEFDESVGYIRTAVQHLGGIIDGLLRLSRVGRVQYEFATVDMNALVADILGAMHGSVLASGARVVTHELPAVVADRNAVGQVLANVLGNAVKFFDPSRPGLIEISANDDDPPIFSIKDNGVGIPVEYQSKVFHAFQRSSSNPEPPQRGEGMGLALVHRIVERHGGRIWFESTPGEGTTFRFTIGRRAPRAEAGESS